MARQIHDAYLGGCGSCQESESQMWEQRCASYVPEDVVERVRGKFLKLSDNLNVSLFQELY